MAFRNSWLSRPRFFQRSEDCLPPIPEFPELRQPVPNAGDRHLIKAAGMLLTVPGNEGHRGAVVQQSNRGLHLLSGQVKLTGNMGNLDVNHGRQFCTLSARIVSCCRIEESYPNFSWTLRILSCVSDGNCNAMAQASRKFLDISVFDGQSETLRRQPRVEASQRDHIRCFL